MRDSQPIILIKIGGSLITDKTKQFSIKKEALDLICQEVKKSLSLGKLLIIGHGAGSFAHFPAHKYQTHKGIINEDSYRGIAEVAMTAGKLNQIIVESLLEHGVNAFSISPRSMMMAKNHQLSSLYTESLQEALRQQQIPVVFGDQILDSQVGCTIFSTEKVLGFLGLALKAKGYHLEKIIHCGQTQGVYDLEGKTIPEINLANFESFKQAVTGSDGVDVTGGMLHKVEETLDLAKKGIPGVIVDGIVYGTLSQVIQNSEFIGTRIQA